MKPKNLCLYFQSSIRNAPTKAFEEKNTREKKYEDICHSADRDFGDRWIGPSDLFAHLRPFPDLH